MKNIFQTFLISLLFISPFTQAYTVINKDYKLPSEQVRINFSQSVHKKQAKVSFQTCNTCPWETYMINEQTDFYKETLPVNYLSFKQKVKSDQYNPPSQDYIVYISVNIKTKEVFTIKWNYLEL